MTGTMPARCTGGLHPAHTYVRVVVRSVGVVSYDVTTLANPHRVLTVPRQHVILDAPMEVAA